MIVCLGDVAARFFLLSLLSRLRSSSYLFFLSVFSTDIFANDKAK